MLSRLSPPPSASLPAALPALGALLLLVLVGCAHEVAPSGCVMDDDCLGQGEVCVDAACVMLEETSCASDLDCNTNVGEACVSGVCMAGAQTQGGGACAATRDCPVNSYCNTATSQCQPLLAGWCREQAQCTGAQSLCSATSTDVPGRCVECLRDSDCGAGGTCVNPGVCELSDDRGPEPGPGPGPGPTPGGGGGGDPGAEEDYCETQGWYGDQYCDEFCPQPDPDCEAGAGGTTDDECQELGYYGDGVCDEFCANPDPDCGGGGGGGGGDYCEDLGYYGDGYICDDFCPQPDPDCAAGGGGGDDVCADYGWYGDGECDTFCANPDPDCSGGGGGGLAENDSCVSNGQVLECATGLDCIYDASSNGTPTYGSCKRVCASNGECGAGQQCALGFLSSGDGICGTPMSEGQQGCTFWEESGSFCFGGGGGGANDAFLECLSGTCRLVCDYSTNTGAPFTCPAARQCGNNYASYDGYNVDLAICQ